MFEALGLELSQIITNIIGFLIALWLLKKFAWKPLLSTLEERRQKIKSDLESAANRKKEMEGLSAEFDDKLKEIDGIARTRIQEAIVEGNKIAAEIRESARKESREIVTKARADLARDIAKAKVEFRDDMVQMALTAAERLIQERLDEKKHRELIHDFLGELETLK
ncbi:MAG: F0F1 ATP synthase subunit B [Candidatus Zixiibacteriota bacterium]